MDKYEYKLKLEQLKSLVEEKDYKTAADIADTINWRKVRSAATLCMVGEIYDRCKRYDESYEILLMAYDRAAVGRNILYRLTLVSLKMGNLDEAKDYYEDFLEVAPYDNQKYILRYEIEKLSGADLPQLIGILEEFKEREYREEWAFELAYLYHRVGDGERCVEVCDELILWIGDGKYVERALELKMLYQPLTLMQEEKYREFMQLKGDMGQEHPQEGLEAEEEAQETIQIPKVTANTGRFNTQNLQAEIAKSMQQILDANTKETVTDTMDNLKKMVEDIPYLQIPQEESGHAEEDERYGHIETEEEIDNSLKNDFEEMLAEDWDGQISFSVQGGDVREPQVNGQIGIEEVLADWEKTRIAAEAAMAAAQQRRLESAKARAMQEAWDLLERLHDIIPKLEAGITPKELMEEKYLQNTSVNGGDAGTEGQAPQEMTTPQGVPIPEDIPLSEDIPMKADMAVPEEAQMRESMAVPEEAPMQESVPAPEEAPMQRRMEAPQKAPMQRGMEAPQKAPMQRGMAVPEATMREDMEALQEVPIPEGMAAPQEASMRESVPAPEEGNIRDRTTMPEGKQASLSDDIKGAQEDSISAWVEAAKILGEPIPEEYLEKLRQEALAKKNKKKQEPAKEAAKSEEAASNEENGEPENPSSDEGDAGQYLHSVFEAAKASREEKEKVSIPQIQIEEPEQHIRKLSPEQKKIFSYFVPISGMEQQLCQVLEGALHRKGGDSTSASGNILITGGRGSGKTVLATDLIKVIQKSGKHPGGKVGKITGKALNKKELSQLLKKVAGGYLIVEKAGDISKETATALSLLMEQNTDGLLIIMEDTSSGIKKLLGLDMNFSKKFTERIKIPIFTSDELVEFAKAYADEQECEIDDMGILALYNRISNIQKLDEATTLTEVKDIVDEAIASAERGGLKKLFGGKKFNPKGYLYLREKDFED